MSISTVASITLSVLSLTAFIIFAYDKIQSDFFKTYKAPIFLGSAFLVFAILGLPYMSYDASVPPPSFRLVVLGFAAVFILGTLLVYTINMSYETYIMAVSCIAILTTLLGRMSGSDEEMSPLAQQILYLVMGASIVYGGSVGIQKVSWPVEWQPVIQFLVGISPILLWGIMASGLFVVFRTIAESASKQPTYPTKAAYEPFQAQLAQEMKKPIQPPANPQKPIPQVVPRAIQSRSEVGTTVPILLGQIQAAIARLQENAEIVIDQTDSTCSIVKDVEQGYIGARSAPTDESEYDLPKEEQEKRKAARTSRAATSFSENRRVYSSIRDSLVPMLECFQSEVVTDTEEDLDLRMACQELQTLLDNQEVLVQVQKSTQVQIALEFANKQLNRAEGFQTSSPSQSLTTLRGPALIAIAQQLLLRELDLTIAILRNEQDLKATQDRVKKQMYKASMIQKGDFNATPEQLKANGF